MMVILYKFAEDFGDVTMTDFDLGAALRENLARTEEEMKEIRKKIYSERNLQGAVFVNENLIDILAADFETPPRPSPVGSPDSGLGNADQDDDFHSVLLSDSEEDDNYPDPHFSPEDQAVLEFINGFKTSR